MPTPAVIAYTDGGCRGNPGPGAWAYLIIDASSGRAIKRADAESKTTNNRMELFGVLAVLRALRKPGTAIEVRSDSKYTIDCCSTWMAGWKKRGWTRKGGELKNVDLLKELDAELAKHQVTFQWVKGHAGDPGNEAVDEWLNRSMDALAAGEDTALEAHLTWPVG